MDNKPLLPLESNVKLPGMPLRLANEGLADKNVLIDTSLLSTVASEIIPKSF